MTANSPIFVFFLNLSLLLCALPGSIEKYVIADSSVPEVHATKFVAHLKWGTVHLLIFKLGITATFRFFTKQTKSIINLVHMYSSLDAMLF